MFYVVPVSEILVLHILTEASWAKTKPIFLLLEGCQHVFNLRGPLLAGRDVSLLSLSIN